MQSKFAPDAESGGSHAVAVVHRQSEVVPRGVRIGCFNLREGHALHEHGCASHCRGTARTPHPRQGLRRGLQLFIAKPAQKILDTMSHVVISRRTTKNSRSRITHRRYRSRNACGASPELTDLDCKRAEACGNHRSYISWSLHSADTTRWPRFHSLPESKYRSETPSRTPCTSRDASCDPHNDLGGLTWYGRLLHRPSIARLVPCPPQSGPCRASRSSWTRSAERAPL